MGQVFLATHATLQIPFALKQGRADKPIPEVVVKELDHTLQATDGIRRSSSPQMTESDFPTSGGTHTDRFLREALLLARLQHGALPTLYDYFLEDGYWYLVMDYIPGPTLSAYMHKYAPLPPLEALNYAMQLCDVLEYLHKQNPPVVFRDLKPSNIILTPEGRVTLVDFGIARYFKAGQMNDTAEFGSPGYAPPEQYQGGSQTDGRSDLYSLGVILHEMLSGKRPTNMGGKLESLHYLNPAISSILSGLVVVATRTEPMYRFQSARTFYLALERAYTIEERRAYQNSILSAEQSGPAQWAFLQPFMAAQNQEAVAIAAVPQSQRASIRESLQEARRERIEQEQAAIHLDSIDQSLQHRSNMGITSKSLPIIDYGDLNDLSEEEEEEELPSRRTPGLPRLLKIAFVLALIVFVVLASLHVADFFTGRASLVPTKQPTQVSQRTSTTTTATVTAISGSSWQALPSLPSPEADNTAVYVQIQGRGYIYVSGGFRGPKLTPRYDRSLYRYNIATARWETVVSRTFPGMVNNAVAQDEQHNLFFTIGFSSDSYTLTSGLYQYQPATGALKKILAPLSTPIGFAAAMIADQQGHLYISQGFMSAGNPRSTAGTGWYRYDIATGQWHVLAPMPVGLGYVVLSPDNAGGILLLGGSTDAGQRTPSTRIYRYNITQNAWTTEPTTSPVPLTGAASCLNGQNQLVIIGGYDAVHNQSLGQTWLVDTRTLNWTSASPLPGGGSFLGAAACDSAGHVYLVRGANDPSQPTPDFEELTVP
jgi:serine/threonine protein kinase